MASPSRTLVLGTGQFLSSSFGPVFPVSGSDSVLDYSIDAAAVMTDMSDDIASVALSIAPSGSGELVSSNLSASNQVVTVWLGGGVPGRYYRIKFAMTTASGRVFETVAGLQIDPALASYPLPVPPSFDYGNVDNWTGDIEDLVTDRGLVLTTDGTNPLILGE